MARVKVPFGERYRTSKAIFRESMALLRKERDLWVFGILAGVSMLVMMLCIIVPIMVWLPQAVSTRAIAEVAWLGPLAPILVLPLSYPFSLFGSLCQSALAFALHERMARRKCTREQAWKRAVANLGPIARFNLLAMVVTGVFVVIGQLLNKLQIVPYVGTAIQTVGAYAWAVASFFVIPVLVVKNEGSAVGALRQSVDLARSQWGKATAGMVTIGLAFLIPFLVYLVVVILAFFGAMFFIATNAAVDDLALFTPWVIGGFTVAFALPIVAFVPLQMSAMTAYQTGLYRYATTGKVPKAFSRATIVDAWAPYREAQP